MANKRNDIIKNYDEMYNTYVTEADKAAEKQKANTEAEYLNKLRSAYITNIQNQRQQDNTLKKLGVRGGASESANLNLANTYNANRNQIASEKTSALNTIDTNTEANKLDYKLQNDSAKLSALETYDAEQRQLAQTEKERIRQEKIDAYSAKYGKIYNLSKLNNALRNAKTRAERIVINNRIAYLKQNKKGY